ncbi:MAG: CRISPR-associated protein Cas2 [Chloroflexi bacterium]|nr:CRISPR-associated protein Cas2 [Dehalococcoidia bacterium]MYD48913.1 CRISPR-associated protein Cas2 [Chloroflexota bacterium]
MATYIVTYDLSAPGRNYDDLYKRIKAYGTWAQITESSWAIVTDKTATSVRDNLGKSLDTNDKLFVGDLSRPYAWRGLGQRIGNWLAKNVK